MNRKQRPRLRMLAAGLAVLGMVAALALLQPGRGLGIVEDPLPSIDLPLPSIDLPLPLPSIDLPLPLPSVDLSSPLPSIDPGSPPPSIDLGSPPPGVDDPDPSPPGPGLDEDPAPSAPDAPAEPAPTATAVPTGGGDPQASPEAGAPPPTGAGGGGDGLLGELTLPALVVGIPLLVLIAVIAAQVAAGAMWLPVIRRVLGRGRPGDADAALPDRPQEPSAG